MRKYWAVMLTLGAALSVPAFAQYKPISSMVREITRIHVNKDGTSTEEVERTRRIDTAQGVRTFGEQKVTYTTGLESVEVLEAYTLRPDGTKIQVEPDKIRTQDESGSDGDSIYSDRKAKVIIFPNLEVGGQTYYKTRTIEHTALFPGRFYWNKHFSPHSLYEDIRVHLTHDPEIQLKISLKGAQQAQDAQDVKVEQVERREQVDAQKKSYLFTFSQKEAFPQESGRIALIDFSPHILITSFKDYAEVGLAYQERAYDKTQPTPAIEALAKEIVGKETDPLKQARLLYNWVAHNIRYVGIYAGAGGFVPHEAQSILDNRYGDCKDHVVILESLLRAIGIDSSPALINAGDSYRLPDVPMFTAFNHVITYLPKFNLFVDSTDEFLPFGLLNGDAMDKPVVLTATGEVKRTPKTSPEKDFVEVHTKLRMSPDGSVVGRSVSLMRGTFESESRRTQFGYENKDQESIVNDLLERFMERGTGKIMVGNPKNLDHSWKVESEFQLAPVVNVPGPSAMTVPVGVAPGYIKWIASSTAPKARRYPSSCSSIRHTELTELSFPAKTKLEIIPKSVQVTSGRMRYEASYRLKGKTLIVKREYASNRETSVCDANNDRHWEAISRVMERDMRSQIFFR